MEIDQEEPESKTDERKKVIQTGLVVIVVLAVGAGLYYFLTQKKPKPAGPPKETPAAALPGKEAPVGEGEALTGLPAIELDKSDEWVSRLAKEISSHPQFDEWLKSKDIIRRFTAAVDNIANGLSPRQNIFFFQPETDFKVIKKGEFIYADPEGYSRYNTVADVFVSLDSQRCALLYRGMKPVIQEAYRELGYPSQDFSDTLLRAIVELLEVPIIDGDLRLEKTVVNYRMVDPVLEEMSEPQKHLLRMGPENAGAIQTKLREMAAALGFPDFRLPRSRTYAPRS